MEIKTQALHLQQLTLQTGYGTAFYGAVNSGAAGDMGGKAAGKAAGDRLSFSEILAGENEKQRKMQHLRTGHQEELKKVQTIHPW